MKYNWNKEILETVVKESDSYSEVLRKLEIPIQGNNANTLKNKIKEYNIDISHFTFGKQYTTGEDNFSYVPASEYLGTNKSISAYKLKLKLIKEGYKENKCEKCGISEWQGEKLNCQLHHIDGNPNNNNLDNLQILCPNCHSQTDNFCIGKTEKKVYYCQDCGIEISKGAKYCHKCASKHHRKVERPDKEELIEKYKTLKSFAAIGREYNVSDKTVSKWFTYYELPGKAKDLKIILGV